MKFKNLFTFRDFQSIIFSVFVAVFAVVLSVSAATTISTNINTGGTLTVSGASTLIGAVNVAGSLNASSTLLVTGNVLTYGDSTFGDAASDANLFTGMLNASSTIAVTGVSRFYNDVRVNGYATTTASNGNIATNGTLGVASSSPSTTMGVAGSAYIANGLGVGAVNTTAGTVGIGTTTPSQELSVVGDALLTSTGTSTIVISSTGTNRGGCIEMRQADTAAVYRLFMKNGSLVAEAGQCQ